MGKNETFQKIKSSYFYKYGLLPSFLLNFLIISLLKDFPESLQKFDTWRSPFHFVRQIIEQSFNRFQGSYSDLGLNFAL